MFFLSGPLGFGDGLSRYFDGSTQTLLTTAAQINQLATFVPSMTVASNLAQDPLTDASFQLASGSPCIDSGTATEPRRAIAKVTPSHFVRATTSPRRGAVKSLRLRRD